MGRLFAIAYPTAGSLGVWIRIENEDWIRQKLTQRHRQLGGRADPDYFNKMEAFLTNAAVGDIEEITGDYEAAITPLGVEE